ncbi:MAG: TrkH family potassium uptake protein, partial [Alphaproteobacteria bacterium]
SYTDAYFETMAGLTTTGSTIIVGLDQAPRGILLWRALLHWLGGMGIVVMAVAVLPLLRVGGMQLFRTESSDRSEKVLPSPVQIARAVGVVYVGLSAVCALAYHVAGMTVFDAVVHSMATLSTGGFSSHDASFAYFKSPALELIATGFMIAGGLPFVLFIRATEGRPGDLWRDQQVRAFLSIIAAVALMLALWLALTGQKPFWEGLRLALFNVTSIITTTGFTNIDYGAWGGFALVVILLVTFFGGCTGGTTGGIKIYRLQVIWLTFRQQVSNLVHPHGVFPLRYNRAPLPADIPGSVMAFTLAYVSVWVLLAIALAALGLDFLTSVSGAATALGNVGPGLGPIIGPVGNFAPLPDAAKWLLSLGMVLGRLELLTLLVLLAPRFWRG